MFAVLNITYSVYGKAFKCSKAFYGDKNIYKLIKQMKTDKTGIFSFNHCIDVPHPKIISTLFFVSIMKYLQRLGAAGVRR